MVVEMGEKAPHSGGRERVRRTVTGASALAGDLGGGGGAMVRRRGIERDGPRARSLAE